MKNIVMVFLIWFVSILTLSAQDCILENSYIRVVIDDEDGTFGSGKGKDKILGIYNKKLEVDYLTLGIHFEFFSLKIDNRVYANDNSVFQQSENGDYGGFSLPDKRENKDKKLKTQLTCYPEKNKSKTITQVINKLEVRHNYSLRQNNNNSAFIQIDVEVENISYGMINSVKYARGIDPDPVDATTINEKGKIKKNLTTKDLVFSEGETNKAPLGIYTRDKMIHNVAMICMNDNHCKDYAELYYDPDIILNNSGPNNSIEDAAIYIAFNLGSLKPNEVKKFSFKYFLGDNIDDVFKDPKKATGRLKKDNQVISYKYIDNYEKINESDNHIIFDIQKGKNIKKVKGKYNYKLKAKNIPKGIKLHFENNKILSALNTTITIPFSYDVKIPFTVHRNKEFRSEDDETITFSLKTNDGISTETEKLKIIPKPRKITFEIDKSKMIIPLSKLEFSEPIPIKILADEKKITPDEYKKFNLEVKKVDGIDWKPELINDKTAIKLKLDSLTNLGLIPMYCLTNTREELPITVGVDKGVYPGDIADDKLSVKIEEDMTLWEQCQMLVYVIFGILFLLWYLFGLFKKDRFCRTQTIDKYKIYEDDDKMRIWPPIKFMKKVPWWQELIPYKSEWITIDNMKFIAGRDCSTVYLAKKTQDGLEINGFELDNPGKHDEPIYHNSMIFIGTEEYNIR